MRVNDSADTARRRAPRTRESRHAPRAIRISLLGGFAVRVDGVRRDLPRSVRRLVALLALNPRGLLRSDAARRLAPQLETRSARASLRKTLTRLRATRLSMCEADGAALRLDPRVTVDVWEAEALAASLAADPAEPPDAGSTQLLTLELLPGWDDDWAALDRTRLGDLFLEALEIHARQLAANGSVYAALVAAHAALRADPLRESTARVLVEIHLGKGNAAQSARAYLSFRRRLRAALGTEPSEAMRAQIAPLLARRPRS